MKKLLTLILCLAMVLTVFAGCSSTPATEEGASASGEAAQGEAADSEYKDTLVFAQLVEKVQQKLGFFVYKR